mmetsp:Transcript_1306/g.3197  ORF Transcript_1306/g.3197 Transcript_1306/m.3197 type:complete len:229 (-) Transcript_1306:354-1040(-)
MARSMDSVAFSRLSAAVFRIASVARSMESVAFSRLSADVFRMTSVARSIDSAIDALFRERSDFFIPGRDFRLSIPGEPGGGGVVVRTSSNRSFALLQKLLLLLPPPSLLVRIGFLFFRSHAASSLFFSFFSSLFLSFSLSSLLSLSLSFAEIPTGHTSMLCRLDRGPTDCCCRTPLCCRCFCLVASSAAVLAFHSDALLISSSMFLVVLPSLRGDVSQESSRFRMVLS